MEIRRGMIVLAELDNHARSSLQNGMRPCVVVSNDVANKTSPVITVCPMTAKGTKAKIPTHVVVDRADVDGVMRKESTVLIEQMTAIDKKQVISGLAELRQGSGTLTAIENAILRQTGIDVWEGVTE